MTQILQYEVYGQTHKGKVRTNNEDNFFARAERPTLLVVADGMGGHAKGEVASSIAVDTIKSHYGLVVAHSRGNRGDVVMTLISAANKFIKDEARTNPAYKDMGTTVVVAIPYHKVENGDIANYMTIGHVGDSRCYGLRGDVFRQLTDDHSMGDNRLSRALGHGIINPAEINEVRVEAGDKFLLCTDGLTNMVHDERIQEILQQDLPMSVITNQLVEAALENGGRDNITVVVARAVVPDVLN